MEPQTITETATTLAHRHAKTMGLRLDEETGRFYLRDDRYVIGLDRNNITNQHRVSMCTVAGVRFEILHDETYTDLDTAVLVVHGLARRHGIQNDVTDDQMTTPLRIVAAPQADSVERAVLPIIQLGPITGNDVMAAACEIAKAARGPAIREFADWLERQPLEPDLLGTIRARADVLDELATND